MSRKRRVFGASFKAQVALSAVRGDQTTAELYSDRRRDALGPAVADCRRMAEGQHDAQQLLR